MGTNYYIQERCPNACKHCTPYKQHLGKSSVGWVFGVRASTPYEMNYPEGQYKIITDEDDFVELIQMPNMQITNEYGDDVSGDEFLQLITYKRAGQPFGGEGEVLLRRDDPRFGPSRKTVNGDRWDLLYFEFS